MKLGIAVVYLVSGANRRLLEVHLDRIRRHTISPYQIHGVALRLDPAARELIEDSPDILLHELPTTQARGAREHTHYLEALLERVFADGCSHGVVLHVDSFPIVDGWDQRLGEMLNGKTEVAAVTHVETREFKPNTACLMMTREFYNRYRPPLLPTIDEFRSEAYREYRRSNPHVPDSGAGVGLVLHRRNLPWVRLRRTNAVNVHPTLAGIYGDMVFHLGAAARIYRRRFILRQDLLGRRVPPSSMWWHCWTTGFTVLDRTLYTLHAGLERALFGGRHAKSVAEVAQIREQLLAAPESFIAALQGHCPA